MSLVAGLGGGSGPAVARLFHALLALCALGAWASLAVQVDVLIGGEGLLPVAPLVESFAALEGSVWPGFPSFLLLDPSDGAIHAGIGIGVALSLLALVGIWPRVCFALSAPLYLSYVVAALDFLSFQWDNLLIECLVLAAFLPRHRPSPVAHGVLRLLLFKLYVESGIAKAQSHLGDWLDGSAMTFYYETAPLPTWPGWWAHQMPESWHQLETWGALGLETFGALLILGPRKARLTALAGFTGFQLLNLATANYGFFVYLALALHVFLLDDKDVAKLTRRFPALPGLRWPVFAPSPHLRQIAAFTGRLLAILWVVGSINTAVVHFGPAGHFVDQASRWMQSYGVYRTANAYHLFGHITRERIEPELQTGSDNGWRPQHFHYKAGDPSDAPSFVAPHQPRVDFRLWFHGLGFQRSTPRYVVALLHRLCTRPAAVQPLFAGPLEAQPTAARIEYWQYHFTSIVERRKTGAWWRRESLGATPAVDCEALRRNAPP